MNKAYCVSLDGVTSAAGMQLQGGPTITAYPIDQWPAPGYWYWVEDLGNGSWVILGGLSKSRPWIPYTPVWTCDGGTPSIGNGTLTGYYQRTGSWCNFYIWLSLGSTTNGAKQAMHFSLPATATTKNEQHVLAKTFTAGSFNFSGFAYMVAGDNKINPFQPQTTTNSTQAGLANADATGAAGTGCPQIAGNFTLQSGNNMWVGGSYECQ
jgi:hypothetical protein